MAAVIIIKPGERFTVGSLENVRPIIQSGSGHLGTLADTNLSHQTSVFQNWPVLAQMASSCRWLPSVLHGARCLCATYNLLFI